GPPALHSFPTRRSSDLILEREALCYRLRNRNRVFRARDARLHLEECKQVLQVHRLLECVRGAGKNALHEIAAPREACREEGERRSEEHTSELQSRENLV